MNTIPQPDSFGIGRQIGLFAGLRWRLFVNSARTAQAKFELVAKAALALLSSVFVFGGAAVLGGAAYFAVSKRPEVLAILFWVVFGVWQFLSLFIGVFNVEFDFRNLLRFPLRFSAFYILSLSYGMFDFAAVMALVWLIGIGVGITAARPDLLPWTLLILSLFAALNLLLNRTVFAWLERILGKRGSREKFFMIFISLMLSLQFFAIGAERWGKQSAPYLLKLKPLMQALPPGIAGLSMESVTRTATSSGSAAALAGAVCLAGYATVFGLILRRRLLSQYQGEELGESEAPQAAAVAEQPAAASRLDSFTAHLPPPIAAILEKEFRYLVRNGPLLMTLAIPPIMVLFFSMTWNNPKQTPGFLKRSPDLMFPSSVGYALLVLMPFAFNSFAYDSRGVQTLLAAPVRFREVLLGKNLAMGAAVFAEAAGIWALVAVLREPPHAATVVATLCMLCFAILANLTVGNLLSLYAPRAFDFGKFRQRQSPITVFSVLGMQILIVLIAIAVFAAALWQGSNWIAAGIFLALAAATLPVYSAVLDFCSGLAERRREKITAELCK